MNQFPFVRQTGLANPYEAVGTQRNFDVAFRATSWDIAAEYFRVFCGSPSDIIVAVALTQAQIDRFAPTVTDTCARRPAT